MMPWPGLIEPFTECFGLGLLGAMCAHHLLLANPILFLLVHTAVWFTFDLLLLKLIEVNVLKVSVKKIQQGWDSNLHVQNTMDKKNLDKDGIRTHACRAQWISSPSP